MDKPIKPTTKPTMTLEDVRKLRLLSMRQLADKASVNVGSISRIEAGATPRLDTIGKLSAALGVKPEEIDWPGDPLGLKKYFPDESDKEG